MQPIVSIVIPVYHGANYLRSAIASALSQSYSRCEVIVVNDGSDDQGRTRSIAKQFGTRIKYIEKEHGGTASALNCGIEHMAGEYFAWCSHDDEFTHGRVERQLKKIQQCGTKMAIAQGNVEFYSVNDGNIGRTCFEKYYAHDILEQSLFAFVWQQTHFSNLLFHCDHFDRIGRFKEDLPTSQDQEMQYRLLRGQKTVFVEESVSKVRVHAQSGTRQMYERVLDENRALYLRMARELGEEEIKTIFGVKSIFYCHIASILKGMNEGKELTVVEGLLERSLLKYPQGSSSYIQDIFPHNVIIFGAGEYGRWLKYELNAHGCYPICFIDNNRSKQGTMLDGIPCCALGDIMHMQNLCAVVSQKVYADIYRQARKAGIKKIYTKADMDAIFLRVPPYRVPENDRGEKVFEMESKRP